MAEEEHDPYLEAKAIEQRLFSNKDIRELLTYNDLFIGEFIRHNLALIIMQLLIAKKPNFFLSDLKFNLFWLGLRTRDRIFRTFRRHTIRFDPENMKVNGGDRVLIIVNAITHVTNIVPVINKLEEQGIDFLIVANSNGAQGKLAEYGIKHISFESYTNKDIKRQSREWDMSLTKRFNVIERGRSLEEITGLKLPWASIKNKLLSLILWTITEIEMLDYMIDSENPSLVVVMNELEMFGRTIVGVSKSKGVPVLYMQHGIVSEHPSYLPVFADKMATWGPKTRDFLVGLGSDPSRIEVTGCPAYDTLVNQDSGRVDDTILRILNLDRDKDIIVLATQPSGFEVTKEHSIRVIKGVIRAMKNFPEKQLILKLHPDEYGFRHEMIVRGMGARNVRICKHRFVSYKLNIFDVLGICDLLITQFSTTAMEAMILDKPVITINLTGKEDVMPYAKSGAAIGVYNEKDIKKAIVDALNNTEVRNKLAEKRRKFVYDFNYLTDGRATERVLDLIGKMIRCAE